MTVGSLTAVSYTYDNANRVTQIAQGTPTVNFAYDAANRRTSLTLPNGVIMGYSYDSASELTGIDYTYVRLPSKTGLVI
jgi:YD repeat-containing protein